MHAYYLLYFYGAVLYMLSSIMRPKNMYFEKPPSFSLTFTQANWKGKSASVTGVINILCFGNMEAHNFSSFHPFILYCPLKMERKKYSLLNETLSLVFPALLPHSLSTNFERKKKKRVKCDTKQDQHYKK